MKIRNLFKKRTSETAGVKLSHCNVIPGGWRANLEHFEKLLSDAGVKSEGIDALRAKAGPGILHQLAAFRAELHNRGILPLEGQAPASTVADAEAPPALVEAITELRAMVNSVAAAAHTGAVARAAAAPATHLAAPVSQSPSTAVLRQELNSLSGKNDAASVSRKGQIVKVIRAIEAGTFSVETPNKILELRAELSGLARSFDRAAALRKGEICAALRQLRQMAA